jgi:hypothetical protein
MTTVSLRAQLLGCRQGKWPLKKVTQRKSPSGLAGLGHSTLDATLEMHRFDWHRLLIEG